MVFLSMQDEVRIQYIENNDNAAIFLHSGFILLLNLFNFFKLITTFHILFPAKKNYWLFFKHKNIRTFSYIDVSMVAILAAKPTQISIR